jgi:iron complex transport system permease protein
MTTTTITAELPSPGLAGRLRSRPVWLGIVGLGALAFLLVAGVTVGTAKVAPTDTIGVILWRVFGLDMGRAWTDATETIVWDIRVPRVLTAMVVGAGLAVSGAALQGLIRNPLADPYILGTATGAAVGAAIAVFIPVHLAMVELGLANGLAFVGALATVYVVLRLGGSGVAGGLTRLLLTGYAISAILAAILTMAMYASGSNLRQIFSFLLGGLGASSWTRLAVAAPLILGASLVIGLRARTMDGFLLGDAAAGHLGVDVRHERRVLLAAASMATAAGVAIAGLIGFVGLVVPHGVRLLVGPSARRLIPLSAIGGAILLSAADLGARMLGDIPVGVVMALIGAPFFLYLLTRSRTGYEL